MASPAGQMHLSERGRATNVAWLMTIVLELRLCERAVDYRATLIAYDNDKPFWRILLVGV